MFSCGRVQFIEDASEGGTATLLLELNPLAGSLPEARPSRVVAVVKIRVIKRKSVRLTPGRNHFIFRMQCWSHPSSPLVFSIHAVRWIDD
jgi:hypothetical protein